MTELGEKVALGTAPKIKSLVGRVVEINFQDSEKLSLEKALISGPHWKFGDNFPGTFSKKPVAYKLSKTNVVVKVKVKITVSENVSGNGDLSGSLGPLTFHGTCPTSAGEHEVEAKIDELPDTVVWVRGDASWGLEVKSAGASFPLGGSRMELFTLVDKPQAPFPGHSLGVPVEALRWVHVRGGVAGKKTAKELVAAITRACHARRNTKYDTKSGGAHFLKGARTYDLIGYTQPTPPESVANCYDQAGAVYLLGRAFGAPVQILYLPIPKGSNFGYINTTALVGVPGCNNPFFKGSILYQDPKSGIVIRPYPKPLAPSNCNNDVAVLVKKGARTSFGNHAFCDFAGKVYDACAGPVTGVSWAEYVKKSIDAKTDYYALWGQKPGTVSDMGPAEPLFAWLVPNNWI